MLNYFSRVGFLVLTLTTCLWLTRLIEWLAWSFSDKPNLSLDILFNEAIYFDFLTAVSVSFYALPLFIFSFLIKKESKLLEQVLFFSILTLHLILTFFYFKSGYLLGNEMRRYSVRTITEIIYTSLEPSSCFFLGSVTLLTLALSWWLFNRKLSLFFSAFCFLLSLIFICVNLKNYDHLINSKDLRFFSTRQKYFHGNNKLAFFLHSNLNHLVLPTDEELNAVKKYPYLKSTRSTCNLCPYFTKGNIKPNIVIILTESLSSSFSGSTNYLGSYTPFLDSLASKSLYWPNCLSTVERTYGVLPAVLSSTAHGTKNGMIMRRESGESNYPHHNSLIGLLNTNGYQTTFGYGGKSDFDNMDSYLKYLKIDEIIDFNFATKTSLPITKKYEWGMGDKQMLAQSMARLKNYDSPFLELLLTTSIHPPFDQGTEYLPHIDTTFLPKCTMSSVVFTDQELKSYFYYFSKLESFKNTIFLIVGDHNIGTLPLRNELETFRVPLIIYSPKLSKKATFTSITSHRAIYPALSELLKRNFSLSSDLPIAGMLDDLPTDTTFKTDLKTSLCLYHKHEQTNLIMGKYILRGEYASEIMNEQLSLKRVTDTRVIERLKAYKRKLILEDYKCESYGYLPRLD